MKWTEFVKFVGSEIEAEKQLGSFVKNKEYRKKYQMKRQAILERVKSDPRFKDLEEKAEREVNAQVKKSA
jgi:hypothetical protein